MDKPDYPTAAEEFVFDGPDSLPDYAKDWGLGFENDEHVLRVPVTDIDQADAPHFCNDARVGDTVKLVPDAPARRRHFEVVAAEPEAEEDPDEAA